MTKSIWHVAYTKPCMLCIDELATFIQQRKMQVGKIRIISFGDMMLKSSEMKKQIKTKKTQSSYTSVIKAIVTHCWTSKGSKSDSWCNKKIILWEVSWKYHVAVQVRPKFAYAPQTWLVEDVEKIEAIERRAIKMNGGFYKYSYHKNSWISATFFHWKVEEIIVIWLKLSRPAFWWCRLWKYFTKWGDSKIIVNPPTKS